MGKDYEPTKLWKKAKTGFVLLANQQGPIKLGKAKMISGVIDRVGSNVEKKVLAVENTYPDKLSSKFTQQDQATFEASCKAYTTAAGEFATRLDEAIKKELLLHDGEKTKLREGFKLLKKHMDAIDASNLARLKGIKVALKGVQGLDLMVKQFKSILKAAVARAIAASARIKAAPTPKNYNKEFPKAARDITQQVGNVKKLRAKGLQIPGPADNVAMALFQELAKFADGPYMSIPVNSTPTEVLAINKKFLEGVKKVVAAYNGVI